MDSFFSDVKSQVEEYKTIFEFAQYYLTFSAWTVLTALAGKYAFVEHGSIVIHYALFIALASIAIVEIMLGMSLGWIIGGIVGCSLRRLKRGGIWRKAAAVVIYLLLVISGATTPVLIAVSAITSLPSPSPASLSSPAPSK